MLSAKFPMLEAEKCVRSARLTNDPKISGRASTITVKWQAENPEDRLRSATMADGRQGWFEIQMDRSPNGWDIGGSRTKPGARTSQETVLQSPLRRLFWTKRGTSWRRGQLTKNFPEFKGDPFGKADFLPFAPRRDPVVYDGTERDHR
jgi:hypothetical protein